MEKETATLNGKPFNLPSGFHLNQDLVPLFLMKDGLRYPSLSKEAKLRLKWMDYYRKTSNAALTCRYFGISRKTFYCWQKR